MRVVLCYVHHRRCIAHYYRRAFEQLGHQVMTVGPWADDYPFGTAGREPSARKLKMRWPAELEFGWLDLRASDYDLFVLIDGGEGLKVKGIPGKWVHLSLEGVNLEWSDAPFKFSGIMRDGTPDDVEWLPGGFDMLEHHPGAGARAYDLCQIATPRAARLLTWRSLTALGKTDLRVLFGEMWGPLYAQVYQQSLSTFVCSTQNFITMRVFEAMAMGCVVFADRVPMISQLFAENTHFIGYDSVECADERAPDPQFLIDSVRRLKRDGDNGVAQRAFDLVRGQHSWAHRALRIIQVAS